VATATRELDEGWAEVDVPYERGVTERDIVALGTHAIAVSPPELVTAVRAALLGTLTAHEEATA
jgi:proteasome accessory factor B